MPVSNVAHKNLCNIGTRLSRGLRARAQDARSVVLDSDPPYETENDRLWKREAVFSRAPKIERLSAAERFDQLGMWALASFRANTLDRRAA